MAKLRGLFRALGALVVIALVFLGGMKMAPYLGFLGFNSKKVTTDTTTITNSFSDIAELATESYIFTEVVSSLRSANTLSKERRFLAWRFPEQERHSSSPTRVK